MSKNGLYLLLELNGGPCDGDTMFVPFTGRDDYTAERDTRYTVMGGHYAFPEPRHSMSMFGMFGGPEPEAWQREQKQEFPRTQAYFAGWRENKKKPKAQHPYEVMADKVNEEIRQMTERLDDEGEDDA